MISKHFSGTLGTSNTSSRIQLAEVGQSHKIENLFFVLSLLTLWKIAIQALEKFPREDKPPQSPHHQRSQQPVDFLDNEPNLKD